MLQKMIVTEKLSKGGMFMSAFMYGVSGVMLKIMWKEAVVAKFEASVT
jgi:hypothetical protein